MRASPRVRLGGPARRRQADDGAPLSSMEPGDPEDCRVRMEPLLASAVDSLLSVTMPKSLTVAAVAVAGEGTEGVSSASAVKLTVGCPHGKFRARRVPPAEPPAARQA